MPRRAPQRPSGAKTLRARAATIETQDDEYYDEQEPSMKLSHAFIVVLILHVVAVGGIFGFNALKARQIANSASHTEQSSGPIQPATSDAGPQDSAKVPDQGAGPQASPPVRQIGAAPAATPAATKPKTHTVAVGETLTKIALRNGTTVKAIERANNLTSAASIRVGQVLKIPTPGAPIPTAPAGETPVHPSSAIPATADQSVPSESTATKASAAPAGAGGTYTVVKGDNPFKIAKKVHVSSEELLKANGITDPKKLQIGQKLIVPVKKPVNASQ